jgi:hypothetical protein
MRQHCPGITQNAVALRCTGWRARLTRPARELGSYAAIELVLPGGSLIALSLWAFRHRAWLGARARRALAEILAFGVRLIFPH